LLSPWFGDSHHLGAESDPARARAVQQKVGSRKKEYDFSKARRNPYASRLRKPVTIRLDGNTISYFKDLARESGIPYQTLINLYLRECAANGKKLSMAWKTAT
jgi:predicted DNA binding CopG/RHH family protein